MIERMSDDILFLPTNTRVRMIKMSLLPISACIIARNEENNIEMCLKSISPYVQECIVVDCSSDDSTASIAASLGAVVAEYKWSDNFSEARNFAIAKAAQKFIFVIDADEVFMNDSLRDLEEYCALSSYQAGRIFVHNLMGNGENYTVSEVTRLFPNNYGYHYVGRIHEQLRINGEVPESISTKVTLDHRGYLTDVMNSKKKIERNIDLLLLELDINGENPYYLYQLARTYYVSKDYPKANEVFSKLFSKVRKEDFDFLSTAYLQYGYSLLYSKNYRLLEQLLLYAIEMYPDYTDLYFLKGLGIVYQGDISKLGQVKSLFEKCLDLGNPNTGKYETVYGVGSFKAHYNLGIYYELVGDKFNAIKHYSNACASGNEPKACDRLNLMSGGKEI